MMKGFFVKFDAFTIALIIYLNLIFYLSFLLIYVYKLLLGITETYQTDIYHFYLHIKIDYRCIVF